MMSRARVPNGSLLALLCGVNLAIYKAQLTEGREVIANRLTSKHGQSKHKKIRLRA